MARPKAAFSRFYYAATAVGRTGRVYFATTLREARAKARMDAREGDTIAWSKFEKDSFEWDAKVRDGNVNGKRLRTRRSKGH